MLRNSSSLSRSSMRRTRKDTGPTHEVVEAVIERAGYCCEVCTHMVGDRRGLDYSIHHRRPRKMGGTRWAGCNRPPNLLLVCGSGTSYCHGAIESERAGAVAAGWLVLSYDDPARVPVLIEHGSRWVYLTDDAWYSDNPPERAP